MIGRIGAGATAFEGDSAVEAEHVRITPTADGRYLLEDVGTRSGTLVDGVPIPAPTIVEAGRRFEVGASTLEIVEAVDGKQGAGRAALAGIRPIPEELFNIIGMRAPVSREQVLRVYLIALAASFAANVYVREIALRFFGVADDLEALRWSSLALFTFLPITGNTLGFYKTFRRPPERALLRYVIPTIVIPAGLIVLSVYRSNHSGAREVATTVVVTGLGLVIGASLMLGLRARVARARVAGARAARTASVTGTDAQAVGAALLVAAETIAAALEATGDRPEKTAALTAAQASIASAAGSAPTEQKLEALWRPC